MIGQGPIYEYCTDCGAVRQRPQPNRPIDPWHSCAKCRLPGATCHRPKEPRP
jgi:hypothetical protein